MDHMIDENGKVQTAMTPTEAIVVLRSMAMHRFHDEAREEAEALFNIILAAAVENDNRLRLIAEAVEGWKREDEK